MFPADGAASCCRPRGKEHEIQLRSFLDEIQRASDSFILVHFLISCVNERFDQAELQIGRRSVNVLIKV